MYVRGEIEEPLGRGLVAITGLSPGERDYDIRNDEGQLITVPDFTWPDAKVAVFCDGFVVHGNREALELDARKRNQLQTDG